MTATPLIDPPPGIGDRNLALINYGLLFASVFFVGVPGLIAVIIAYSQRDAVTAAVRRHYKFQIRIFWIAFALGLLGTITAVWAAVMGIGQLATFGFHSYDAWEGMTVDTRDIRIDGNLVLLASATVISWLAMALWLIAAPAYGFIRLASERRIGDGAA